MCGVIVSNVTENVISNFFMITVYFGFFFFFSSRRRHTRWPRDWSSDVCSSDLYGSRMPLNQVASLSVPEPAMIIAQPFDPSQLAAIEKAIRASDLGLNPANDGKVVRIPIPALTEERRKELSRHVHKLTEEGRNSVRAVRRDANERLKKLLKDHKISEDDERTGLDEVQRLTDNNIKQIDELQKKKDQELLGK